MNASWHIFVNFKLRYEKNVLKHKNTHFSIFSANLTSPFKHSTLQLKSSKNVALTSSSFHLDYPLSAVYQQCLLSLGVSDSLRDYATEACGCLRQVT